MSLVLHPRNPYAPTAHMNVRCFVAMKDGERPVWWFGGGMDLTPYYGFEEDARHFHAPARTRSIRSAPTCIRASRNGATNISSSSTATSRAASAAFSSTTSPKAASITRFAMTQSVGDALSGRLPADPRAPQGHAYGERERDFQAYRRGRYVEFNLVYDRGTLFGLQSGGRTESILMSLPPMVKWRYDWHPAPGSAEAQLYNDFLTAREWI